MEKEKSMTIETLAAFAKRRGFVFQSSEIYGGFAAVYDYAHYGALMRENIKQAWVKEMIRRDDVKLLDSAVFMHPTTWKASGHVDSFADPEIDCKSCKNRFKADHLLEPLGYTDVDRMEISEANKIVEQVKAEGKLKCPVCGGKDLTDIKRFDLLVKSNLGSPTSELSEENVVYLRGETCQGIYLNYKNYLQNMRVKVPFGIAQVGKAFRNEVVARQYTFRMREFEQCEMQYFVHPTDEQPKYDYWKKERMRWWKEELGVPAEMLRFKDHEKLAHYAKAACDVEYDFNVLGKFAEVEGIHQRGDWDLSQHQKFSGENLEYFDQDKNEKYIPHIVETSGGLDRMFLAVLDSGYTEETLEDGSERVVLKVKPSLAPIKVAVFPLIKKPELTKLAKDIYQYLLSQHMVEYDETGSIGKRYRRQDEIGTPFCITVDFESLEDNMVTLRNRDTLEQERIKIDDMPQIINSRLYPEKA
ncbi:MAG: glycine--tRNA ligase [Candidatus Dojkabacteria bacterium]|nr:MAG: glycine--tRNA ligase [Candidatus Dojkabacteria bacterium]